MHAQYAKNRKPREDQTRLASTTLTPSIDRLAPVLPCTLENWQGILQYTQQPHTTRSSRNATVLHCAVCLNLSDAHSVDLLTLCVWSHWDVRYMYSL